MSILIDGNTKVLVQGITGKEGQFWSKHMIDYGTNIVAGVTPFKEGEIVGNVPVFHSVENAVKQFDIEASLLLVPPKGAYDAILEAINSGIKIIVVTAEGIPMHELAKIRFLTQTKYKDVRIIGANSTGIISTGKAMMGFFPYWIERVYKPGRIGVLTRSGSLTNEITAQIVASGHGTSSIIGVGGDGIPFTRFAEMATLFEKDNETDAIVMIGEIGGTMEEEVAELIQNGDLTKPLIAFLGGRTAPKGKQMGHAGAIITGGKGSVSDKIEALESAGAHVAERPSDVCRILKELLPI